nr:RNA-directed DNA polymerase, eukaryota, reverse transcriptase zinc-binding domain protein [Tanacetum cinerariifolium]
MSVGKRNTGKKQAGPNDLKSNNDGNSENKNKWNVKENEVNEIRRTANKYFVLDSLPDDNDQEIRILKERMIVDKFLDKKLQPNLIEFMSWGYYMYKVVKKLKSLKSPLNKLGWSKGNLFKRIKDLRLKLKDVQTAIDADPHNQYLRFNKAKLVEEFYEAKAEEEKLLYQQAKIKWLCEGDKNSSFFHIVLKGRKSKSNVNSIIDNEGVMHEREQIPQEFIKHFQEFLGTKYLVQDIKSDETLFKESLKTKDAEKMISMFLNKEIKDSLFDINDSKAPGFDGFSSPFFKKAWNVIGLDICKAVNELFKSGKILGDIGPLFQYVTHRDLYDEILNDDLKVRDMIGNGLWLWQNDWFERFLMITSLEVLRIDDQAVDKIVWKTNNGKEVKFPVIQVNFNLNSNGPTMQWWRLVCVVRRLVMAANVYNIWSKRNRRIFLKDKGSSDEVYKNIIGVVKNRMPGISVKDIKAVKKVESKWLVSYKRYCKNNPGSVECCCKNSVLDMYVKCGGVVDGRKINKAHELFDVILEKSIVSWTAMISGYVRVGSIADALDIFHMMQMEGVKLDWISLLSVLPTCARIGALEMRKSIRGKIMAKTPRCSSTEVDNVVEELMFGVDSKPFIKEVYWMLELLALHHKISRDLVEIIADEM